MSAPHTNIDKQKRRHRGPLIGMALVVVFAVGLIVYWLLEESSNAANPAGGQVDESGEGATIEGVESGTATVPDAPAGDAGTRGGTPPQSE